MPDHNEAKTVVLVHGAWHGAWCWDSVVESLKSRSILVHAVDLNGGDPAARDLHSDADRVLEALDVIAGQVVLVGHSYGGAVITDAGRHKKVDQLVFLTAFVPLKDEPVIALSPDETSPLASALVMTDDASLVIDSGKASEVLYNDCSDEQAQAATARLIGQSTATFTQLPRAVSWTDKPATYVVCGSDNALPPDLQRAMARRIPNATVHEWPDASHSPFLSNPDRVADLLADIARRP